MAEDHCRLESTANFRKGETILSLDDHTGRCGVLQSGEAHVYSTDADGNENLLEVIHAGDSFGEYFFSAPTDHTCIIVADTDCTVTFINMARALAGCSNECGNHQELMKKLLLLSTRYAQTQSIRVTILSQRTLRDKLLTYFDYQSYGVRNDAFDLPMTFSDLAAYLSVNRSAMMREIKNMNDEGLIRSEGRRITLLN